MFEQKYVFSVTSKGGGCPFEAMSVRFIALKLLMGQLVEVDGEDGK